MAVGVTSPSSAGARAKVDWAKAHIEELAAAWQAFYVEGFSVDQAWFPDGQVLGVYARMQPPMLAWSVMVGNVVHNLRSALDHLAWQLVLANGQQPTTQTQFDIVDPKPPRPWAESPPRRMRGVAPNALAQIERFQPFSHSDPTRCAFRRLRDLSNTDKHQVLHLTTAKHADGEWEFELDFSGPARVTWSWLNEESVSIYDGCVLAAAQIDTGVEPVTVMPRVRLPLELALGTGELVGTLLRVLATEVQTAIEVLEPCLAGLPPLPLGDRVPLNF